MPSTLLNIIDLLGDWREVTKKNEDVSKIYILYQVCFTFNINSNAYFIFKMGIMVGTFIGPGAIYMVLAGSLQIVFGLDIIVSLLINAVPIFAFSLACYYADSKFQLALAKLLTLFYIVMMLAVYVGVVVEIVERGFLSAAAVSAYSFFMPLLLAGLLHPEEAYCMLYMIVYLITIPSMYVLLVIYSLFNLNDISWGTREAAKTKEEQRREEQEKLEIEEWKQKNSGGGLFNAISSGLKFSELGKGAAGPVETGSVDFSIGNVLRCMCFTKEDPQETKLDDIKKDLKSLDNKLNNLARGVVTSGPGGRRRSSVGTGGRNLRLGSLREDESETSERPQSFQEEDETDEPQEEIQETRPRRDSLSSPYWIEDERLGNGKVDFLKATEITFWQNMIKKYLLPFTPSPVEQAKQKKELSEYRDSFIFTFVLINILYITLVIMLQIGVDLKVPWTVFERFDVHGEDGIINEFEYKMPEEKGSIPEVKIIRTNVDKLDVIGLFFLAMFSSVVFAQMIGMLLHRWQTREFPSLQLFLDIFSSLPVHRLYEAEVGQGGRRELCG